MEKKMIRTISDLRSAPRRDGEICDDGRWENEESFSEQPCPACKNGVPWSADFPNGGQTGTCLNCDADLEWNESLGNWDIWDQASEKWMSP